MKAFADILKRRVQKGNHGKIKLDFYTIKKATEDILLEIFGNLGKKNIQIKFYKDGFVYFKIFKSIWKTEVNLNRGLIIGKLQHKLKNKNIKGLRIIN